MSPFDAPADALIEAGWGHLPRLKIPADWQTRRGPSKWSDPAPPDPLPKAKRAPRRPSGLPKWRQRRAKWLIENGLLERYALEFGK